MRPSAAVRDSYKQLMISKVFSLQYKGKRELKGRLNTRVSSRITKCQPVASSLHIDAHGHPSLAFTPSNT